MDKKEPNTMGSQSFPKDRIRKKPISIQKGKPAIPMESAQHLPSTWPSEKHDSFNGHLERTVPNPELLFTERVRGGLQQSSLDLFSISSWPLGMHPGQWESPWSIFMTELAGIKSRLQQLHVYIFILDILNDETTRKYF